jgi:CRP/FNR family transcriptional regulator, nitrogen oxide reductase regulator
MLRVGQNQLSGIRPFRKLGANQLSELVELSTEKNYRTGDAIFHEGARARRFYLLLHGYVRVVKGTAAGSHIVPLYISPGRLFGIAPAFAQDRYPATAVAANECLTVSWPASLWTDFLARYDGFAEEVWRDVGSRIKELHSRISELTTEPAEQRIASAVLRLCEQSGRPVEGGIEIAFPVTRSDIAEMTGTNLHTVSRLLSAWEREGLIFSRRKYIRVTTLERLRSLSQQDSANIDHG